MIENAKAENQVLENFRDYVAELAETWYDKDELKAFRHAAFQQVAPDPLLSDQQVIELTAIDKQGDLEIDGWFTDETGETILLFQSVGGGNRVTEAKVMKFWEAPNQVLDPARVDGTPNQSVKELSEVMRERLAEGYAIKQVFASRGGFEKAAKDFARPKARIERSLVLPDGTRVVSPTTLELLGETDIARSFDDYRAGFRAPPTDVEINVDPRLTYRIGEANAKSLRATIPATELVRIFRSPGMGFRLFSLNPRGPLASAKVNKSIGRTLDTPDGRRNFHLLNNGLCATCDGFDLGSGRLVVNNFQIVNGCQTTVRLNGRTDSELAETMVDLKLAVANRDMAESIAGASNSQTALRARDYASFEKQQLQLQHEFETLRPPWYYEIKQGYWRYVLDDKEKARFKTGRRKRHIEVQPLAQAALAFLGYPAEALDRVRFVFEGIRTPEEREAYERAFPTTVKARQLLLPLRMLDYLERESDKRLRFSTFHILWLSASLLRQHYGLETVDLFSLDTSQRLLDSMDDWLPDITRVVNAATKNAYRRAQGIVGPDLELRAFFRASEIGKGLLPTDLLLEALESELQIEADNERDPRAKLP